MSTPSDTPRTDEHIKDKWAENFVTTQFAQGLERELTAAHQRTAEELNAQQRLHVMETARLTQERDEALARVRELEAAMRPANGLRKTVLFRDYSEIIDHLQLCQDNEDMAAGDMGHRYFDHAITAIKDLDALVMDLTKCDPALVMKPLGRPDKAGHWWLWIPEKGRWDYLIVEHPTYMQNGIWLPATPPPPPSKEDVR